MRTVGFLALACGLLLAGCFVEPTSGPSGGSGGVVGSGAVGGGSPSATPVYHLLAGGSATVPDGDLGYVVTANGQGGYRLAFIDTLGTAAELSGTVTTDGAFDPAQLASLSGGLSYTLVAANRIDFDAVPGATIDGFDLVSSTDPIYLDAHVNGATTGFDILFADAATGATATSAYDPVAFTAP